MTENICSSCRFISDAAKKLDPDQIVELDKNCLQLSFKKGEIIFRQGSFSSNIIFVKKGLIKIHITGPKEEQIIKISKSPTYLGIPTTINEKINQYSATAIEPTDVCFIDLNTFKEFVSKNGKFAYEIMIELCKNEIKSFKKCVNRTQKNINGRVAESLLFFYNDIYGQKSFSLPLTRAELGNLTDSSRESISRVLSEFHKNEIIKIENKKITILNESLINKISEKG